jgi:DNA polymerase elongation subunit (family B)
VAAAQRQTAVLVIRLWIEEGSKQPLRARITQTLNVSAFDEPETRVAASEQEIVKAVRGWIRRVLTVR